jgi:hypothetical protein
MEELSAMAQPCSFPSIERCDVFTGGGNHVCKRMYAVRLAAEAYDIPFLSRYDAFNGANHNEDPREKGYIRSDGEHPSDLAGQYTAELLSQMGYEPVPSP